MKDVRMNSRHSPLGVLRFSVVTLIVILSTNTPAVAQQKQAPAIEEVATAIGQALKALIGAKPPAAKPAIVAPMPVMDAGFGAAPMPRPEKVVQERLERLQAHGAVLKDWVDLHAELSDEQKTVLTTSLESSTSELQKTWQQQPAQRGQQALDDFFPLNFTDDTGPALAMDKAGVNAVSKEDVLSNEKIYRLSEALDERKAFYRDAALGYVLNLLDGYFFLTPEQRKKMGNVVAKHVNLNDACFSLQGSSSRYYQYFQSSSATTTFGALRKAGLLTENQQQLAANLNAPASNGTSNNRYILISTGDDEDTLQQQLRDGAKQQLKNLTRHVATRIDFYQSIASLPDRDVRRLRLASKGAMDEVIATWKLNTAKNIERYKTRDFAGQNVRINMALPTINQLLTNDLWEQTVESLVPKGTEGLFNRRRTIKKARAKFAVAMLDRELWLDDFQRERLLKSVGQLVPAEPDTSSSHLQSTDELSLLCIPLFKMSKLDQTILNPTQRQVWAEMKKPFTEQDGYLRVQTKQVGTMTIRLPK